MLLDVKNNNLATLQDKKKLTEKNIKCSDKFSSNF